MSAATAEEYRTSIAADAERIAALTDANPGASVPSCPGWDMARLAGHVGRVHRMTIGVLTNPVDGFPDPSTMDKPPADRALSAAFVRTGATTLDALLANRDMDSACWNFLNEPPFARFWFRRQCHETSVHRFDAELAFAIGATPTTAPALAVDGIDEYFVFVRERLLAARDLASLGGSLHLHATDVEGEWMITVDGGVITVDHGHGKGDAAVRGTASDLFLGLWGRLDLVNDARFERFGSAQVIAALGALGGT